MIRPTATIFRPFGEAVVCARLKIGKGKSYYVRGKQLKQAQKHAEMAVNEKLEGKSNMRSISESPKSVQRLKSTSRNMPGNAPDGTIHER